MAAAQLLAVAQQDGARSPRREERALAASTRRSPLAGHLLRSQVSWLVSVCRNGQKWRETGRNGQRLRRAHTGQTVLRATGTRTRAQSYAAAWLAVHSLEPHSKGRCKLMQQHAPRSSQLGGQRRATSYKLQRLACKPQRQTQANQFERRPVAELS